LLSIVLVAGLAAETQAGSNCTCRANGRIFSQGQIACVRGKLARCDMNLNNSTWKIIANTCPEVRRTDPLRLLAGLFPPQPRSSSPPSC
jgi:hypothetical protein